MNVELIPIDAVISDYLSRTGSDAQLNRTDLKRWALEAYDKMEPIEVYEHKVAFLDVKNYKVRLPKGFKKLVQVAYLEDINEKIKVSQAVEFTQKALDGTNCQLNIKLDCPECEEPKGDVITVDTDRLWELSHPEYYYAHMKHFYRAGGRMDGTQGAYSVYHNSFRLMRPASGNFFNTDYHIKGCLNLDERVIGNETREYRIEHPMIHVNFESGKLLLSYLKIKSDENGYPLIPNVTEVFEGIFWLIEERLTYRMYRQTGTAHYGNLYQNAAQNKDRYIAQARERLNTPEFDTWWNFVENHWSKKRRYIDFWENTNKFRPDPYDKEFPTY